MSSEGLRSVLSLEHLQVVANNFASAAGLDNVIYVSALCSLQWVCKCVLVLGSLSFTILTSEDDLDGSLGSHDGNLCCGPGVVVVTIEMLGGHNIVGASVCLSCNEGDLGDSGFCVSIKQLSAVFYYATKFLGSTRQESGHITQGDDRDLESIAESNEPCSFDTGIDVQTTSQDLGLVGNHAN